MIRVLLSAEEIATRRQKLAAEVSRDYSGEELLLVCTLKGSMPYFVDLARDLSIPCQYDYISVSSYDGTQSARPVQIHTDVATPIEGRHVLLVEDIVDTGRTADFLLRHLRTRSPASLRLTALLDKPTRRVVPVRIDYRGFTVPDEFVVGYGLDYEQQYRNLPYIGVLDRD